MKTKTLSVRSVPFVVWVLSLTLVLTAFAAAIKEGYISRSATAATNTAEVFFPQNPTKAIRLVHYDINGDTNTALLTLYSGTLPVAITGIANATNLQCVSNSGVQTN